MPLEHLALLRYLSGNKVPERSLGGSALLLEATLELLIERAGERAAGVGQTLAHAARAPKRFDL